MQQTRTNEIKVGIVCLVGIILFISVLIVTKKINFNSDNTSILIQFDNALGLVEGAPVFVNGVKHGVANKVWLNNGNVIVNATIDNINDLKEDCTAEIMMLEITGGKKIEIFPGKSDNILDTKTTILGKNTTDLATTISKFGDITNDLQKAVIKVDTLITNINKVINNPNIGTIIDNTAQATAKLNDIVNSSEVSSIIKSLNNTTNSINNLLADNNQKFYRIVDNIDTASGKMKSMMNNIDTTMFTAQKTIGNINNIVTDIQHNNSFVNKLLYDTSFANKINNLIDSLNALSNQLKQHGINTNVRLGTRP